MKTLILILACIFAILGALFVGRALAQQKPPQKAAVQAEAAKLPPPTDTRVNPLALMIYQQASRHLEDAQADLTAARRKVEAAQTEQGQAVGLLNAIAPPGYQFDAQANTYTLKPGPPK